MTVLNHFLIHPSRILLGKKFPGPIQLKYVGVVGVYYNFERSPFFAIGLTTTLQNMPLRNTLIWFFLSPRWMTLFHHLKLMNWNTKDPSIKTQCRPPSLTEDYFVASLKEALACNDLNQAVNKAKIIIDDLSLWQTIMEFHFGSSSKYHLLVKRHFSVRQKGHWYRIRHILGSFSLLF